jgi:hypothetical protein
VAEAVKDVEVNQQDAKKIINEYRNREKLTNEADMQNHLRGLGLQASDLVWQLLLPYRIRVFSMEKFSHRAENRFLQRKNSLDKVVYSVLRAPSHGLAHEYYHRIFDGESDFSVLTKELANGPEQHTRGIVGPVPLSQAHPQLAERMRISSVGELISPFQIDKWWIVARVESFLPAAFSDTVKMSMCRELFDLWINEELAKKLGIDNVSNAHSS